MAQLQITGGQFNKINGAIDLSLNVISIKKTQVVLDFSYGDYSTVTQTGKLEKRSVVSARVTTDIKDQMLDNEGNVAVTFDVTYTNFKRTLVGSTSGVRDVITKKHIYAADQRSNQAWYYESQSILVNETYPNVHFTYSVVVPPGETLVTGIGRFWNDCWNKNTGTDSSSDDEFSGGFKLYNPNSKFYRPGAIYLSGSEHSLNRDAGLAYVTIKGKETELTTYGGGVQKDDPPMIQRSSVEVNQSPLGVMDETTSTTLKGRNYSLHSMRAYNSANMYNSNTDGTYQVVAMDSVDENGTVGADDYFEQADQGIKVLKDGFYQVTVGLGTKDTINNYTTLNVVRGNADTELSWVDYRGSTSDLKGWQQGSVTRFFKLKAGDVIKLNNSNRANGTVISGGKVSNLNG